MLADEIEHAIDLFLIGADHQGGVSPAQESAGAGEARRPELVFQKRIDDGIGVFVLDDGNDQLFHPNPPQYVRIVAGCPFGWQMATARSWAGAKAEESGRPPGEEGRSTCSPADIVDPAGCNHSAPERCRNGAEYTIGLRLHLRTDSAGGAKILFTRGTIRSGGGKIARAHRRDSLAG